MQSRSLGQTGLSIAPLVFGGNVFGWTIDEETSFKVLDAFVDHGFEQSTLQTAIQLGRPEIRAANPRRSSETGSQRDPAIATSSRFSRRSAQWMAGHMPVA